MANPYRYFISLGRRVISPFRSLFIPTETTEVTVSKEQELPWLEEQMRYFAGNVNRRFTPLTDNLTGETWEMRWAYRRAWAEPMVKACLLGKIGQVASLDVTCVPEDHDNPIEVAVAEFCQSQLIGPSGTAYELAWSILSSGLTDGFSVCEKLYGTVQRGKYAGLWTVRGLKTKDTRYLQFEVDPYRNITGIYSLQGNSGELFDPKDFLTWAYMPFFNSPTGMSDLRASYRDIELIVAVLKLRMIFLDKFTGPFIKGTYTVATMRAQLEKALSEARASGYITLQNGTDVEVLDLAMRGTSDFQAAIDDIRKEFAIGITGAYLQMLEGNQGGDARGDSKVQKSTAEIVTWFLVTTLQAVVNTQILPDLVIPNFGERMAHPKFVLGAVNPIDIVKDLEIDKLLLDMGVPLSKKDIYHRANRKGPIDAEDTINAKPQQSASLPGLQLGGGVSLPFNQVPAREPALTFAEKDAGRWITIGAKESGGKKVGGSPVFVRNGKIEKGAASLHGKRIANLKEEAEKQSRRKENATGQDYEIAKHLKEGRKAGIDPEHIHQLASEIHAHGEALANEHNDMLRRAREIADKTKRADSLQGLIMRHARGGIDHASLQGFDDVAKQITEDPLFRGHFRGGDDDADSRASQLFDKLIEGNREVPSKEDAYRQALETLLEDVHHSRHRKAPEDDYIPFSERNPHAADSGDVALAGKDGQKIRKLLADSQASGVTELHGLMRSALERLLPDRKILYTHNLFTPEDQERFTDSLASVVASAELLARARVRERADKAEAGTADAMPFEQFQEVGIPVMTPERAVAYFRSLVPTLGVDPLRYGPMLRRRAFTLAAASEQTLLQRVQDAVRRGIEAGTPAGTVASQIDVLLNEVGVTPKNPQYSEMVYRTNAMDAYTVGTEEEMTHPDVKAMFPGWQYLGIRDGRQGADHEPHFDNYYPASISFAEVRGPRVYNCRCCPRPVDKYEWAQVQAGPNAVTFAEDKQGHDHGGDGRFVTKGGGSAGSGDTQAPAREPEPDFEPIAQHIPPAEHAKAKSFLGRVADVAKGLTAELALKIGAAAPDILDTAADYSKIFYANHGPGGVKDPFTEQFGIGPGTVATIVSHVMAHASMLSKQKLGFHLFAEGDKAEQIVDVFRALAKGIDGLPVPTVQEVVAWLESRSA